jgi:hypothetical protein
MFFPYHGQSKAYSTMVIPPPFGLPMAHPPWSGADCYQRIYCHSYGRLGALEVGIGHNSCRHGQICCSSRALDATFTQESVCFPPPPPPKPPWPPPWRKNITSIRPPLLSTNPSTHITTTVTIRMSGRHKKKEAAASSGSAQMPSSHPEDFPPLTNQSSPPHKGGSRKRLGPSSPAHQSTGTNPSVSSNPSSAGSAGSGNFGEELLRGRTLNYQAASFVPQGNNVFRSDDGNYVSAQAAVRLADFYRAATEVVNESWEQASHEERSEVGDDGFSAPRSPPCCAKQSNPTNTSSVQFDSPSNRYYELGPSLDSSDSSGSDPSDDRKVSASAKGDGSTRSNPPPPKTSESVSKSPDSGSSSSSDTISS